MRLTSLFALAALLGIWSGAAAQTTVDAFDVDEPLDSMRAPYSSAVAYSAVLQMEMLSATTGKPVVTGTALKLPAINFISDSVLLFNLVGSKTVAATISGVRGTFTAVPGADSGWEQVAPWGVRKTFKTPRLLPAGQFLGCRYDMPAQKISIASVAVTSWNALANVVSVLFGGPVQQAQITWSVVKGNLRCKVGMKAADISAPGVPQPQVSLSANPTSVANSGSSALTWSSTNAASCLASGAWTGSKPISGNESSGALTTTSTFSLTCTGPGGTVSGSATVTVPPPTPLPLPPPSGVSPDGSGITPASGGSLTTAAGAWTFGTATGAGGNVILLNGAQAASGESTELYVLNGGGLYAFNSFSNWFQWSGTSWTRLTVAPPGAPHP